MSDQVGAALRAAADEVSLVRRAHLRARGRMFYIEGRTSEGMRIQRSTGFDIDHPVQAHEALKKFREALGSVFDEPTKVRFQRLRARIGRCEACGWAPPNVSRRLGVLAVHHVVPKVDGGTDELENLAVLCPNCHALAHVVLIPMCKAREMPGYRTRGALLRNLRALLKRAPECQGDSRGGEGGTSDGAAADETPRNAPISSCMPVEPG